MNWARSISFALLCAALAAAGMVPAAPVQPVVYDIPRLDNITIDGKGDDWGTRGFRVEAMHDISQALYDSPRADMSDAKVRLGWDARGLLVLINVVDVSPLEDDKLDSLWTKDSVELYMTSQLGGKDFFQLLLSPGVDGKHKAIRQYFYDLRTSEALKSVKLACSAARTKTANGYVMEVLLPWSNLGVTPAPGVTVGAQVMINDIDAQGALWHKLWYPKTGAAFFSDHMYSVRLAEAPSAPVQVQAYCYQERYHRIVVSAIGASEQLGKTLTVSEGDRLLGSAQMTAVDNERSKAEVLLPLTPDGPHYQTLTATIDGQQFTMDPTPIYFERLKTIQRLQLNFTSYVFHTVGFPGGDFADPSLAENLLGRYTLQISYYDASYHQVFSADTPGRYGALVEVTTESGTKFRRYVTLYRQPVDIDWSKRGAAISDSLLAKLKVPSRVISEQGQTAGEMRKALYEDFTKQPESAVYLAGLAEIAAGSGPVSARTNARSRNSCWWYGLRKQLGISETYPYVTLYPEGFGTDSRRRYPLIIALHGSGQDPDFENFKQIHRQRVAGIYPHEISLYCRRALLAGGRVVAGDGGCHAGGGAGQRAGRCEPCLPHRTEHGRLWHLGNSLRLPERYAAIVPIAGGGDLKDAVQLKHMPVWAFHGADDQAVKVICTTDMVKAIHKAGGHPKMTIYPGVGHGSWGPAYSDPALYAWLFQQQRGGDGKTTPQEK